MTQQGTSWGKGGRKWWQGLQGSFSFPSFCPFLLFSPVDATMKMWLGHNLRWMGNDRNLTLQENVLNYCLKLGFHIDPDLRFDWALGLTALCPVSGRSLAWAIILPPSKPSFPEIISHSFYPLSTKSNLFVPENLTEICSGKALTTCPFTNW